MQLNRNHVFVIQSPYTSEGKLLSKENLLTAKRSKIIVMNYDFFTIRVGTT